LVGDAGWLVRRRGLPLRCTTCLLLAAWTTFPPSLPRRGQDGGACRRAVKVGPSAFAARTADAAPLTAHRSRAVLCPGRGRERGRQAVFAVAISPDRVSCRIVGDFRFRHSGACSPLPGQLARQRWLAECSLGSPSPEIRGGCRAKSFRPARLIVLC